MRIVLAIKETNLRLAVEMLLSEEPGLRVVGVASEPRGLLALVDTTCPDVVVVDWRLPGKPSTEVLKELRLRESPPKTIVIGQDAKDRAAALNAGTDGFVLSGEPPMILLNTIQRCDSSFKPTDQSHK